MEYIRNLPYNILKYEIFLIYLHSQTLANMKVKFKIALKQNNGTPVERIAKGANRNHVRQTVASLRPLFY
jgi:hypothetical protein